METLAQVERAAIWRALKETQGNVPKTAKALGVARNTIYRRVREYGWWLPDKQEASMTCYDEERKPGEMPPERRGPTVVRDGLNVREIAEDPCAFTLHNKPRRKQGRDDDWHHGE